MEDFEQQLKSALVRKEQPPAFEARVNAAVAAERPGRSIFWRWATEVAAVLVIASGFWMGYQHEIEQRAAGEAAKERLQVALKITVTELSKIQRTVRTSTQEE